MNLTAARVKIKFLTNQIITERPYQCADCYSIAAIRR